MYSQCADAILQTLKPEGGQMLAMGYLMDRSIIEHIKNLYWWAKWFTRTVKTAFNSIHACASSILKMHFIFFLILQALISAPHFSCHLGFFFFRTRTPVYSTHTLFSVQFPLVAWSGGCVWAVWALLAPTWRGRPLSFEIKFNRKVLYCLTIHLAFFFLPVICQSCKEVRSFPSLYSNLFFHNVHIVLVNIFLTFLKVESAGRPLYFCGPSFQNNRHGLYGSIW